MRVELRGIGECVVNPKRKIPKQDEYVIKALCLLMLSLMGRTDSEKEKFDKLLNLLEQTTDQANDIFCSEKEVNSSDPLEQF